MVKEIIHDPIFLSLKSEKADKNDISTADDMLETLKANRDRCVGMAANMTGVSKCIIVFYDGEKLCEMFNPEIVAKKDPYEAEEGCLSLTGTRKTKRYKTIKVKWQDRQLRTRIKSFTGFTAQIIQHEVDHCNGKVI